jgi:hypothetical protein
VTVKDGPTSLVEYLGDAETEEFMVGAIMDNLAFYQNIDTNEKTSEFSGSIYNWFIRECVSRNQYLRFPEKAYRQILDLYRALVTGLRKIGSANANAGVSEGHRERDEVQNLVREHRRKLITILSSVSDTDRKNLTILPCAEYSPDFQFRILGLDPNAIQGPFLDIGCGEKAALVDEVRKRGVQAVGIDQYQPSTNDGAVLRANWLEFSYMPDYWGTIVSHMAFSNHFIRAIGTDAELAAWYQAVFMEILDSLKPGGVFCYTPALTRAEAFIDRSAFSILRRTNVPGEPDLDTTQIRRRR